MKTRKLMAVLVMVALFVTALPVVAFGAGHTDYSAAGSTVTVNKTKEDVTKPVTFTVRFREGQDVASGQVLFYVKSSRDAENIKDLVSNDNTDSIGTSPKLSKGVAVNATPDANGIVKFDISSDVAGSAKIGVYKYEGTDPFDVDDALLIGEKTITWESSAKVYSVVLDTEKVKSGKVTAGNSFKLVATVYDDSNYWVEDQDVTFYEYYQAPGKTNYGSRKNIGTAKTNEEGVAKLTIRRDDSGDYAYYARAASKDSMEGKPGDSNAETKGWVLVEVEAAAAYNVTAKDDVKYAELDEPLTVTFVYKDRYGSKVAPDGFNMEDDVEIIDPKGDNLKKNDYNQTGFSGKPELEVKFTPDKEGEYEVRAFIPSTGIYAKTIVNTNEFGKAEKLGMKLYTTDDKKIDNAAVKLYDGEDNDENEYQIKVYEYDKNGVERNVDASDVYFSTSDAKIATVDRDGLVTLKKDATGVVTIAAVHEDGELTAELDITVSGDPVGVEVDVEVDGLKAKVKLTYFDKNDNLAVEGENDEGYQVMAGDLEVTDVDDFKNGKAKFTLLAEEYGSYKVRVVTDEGLSVSFDVKFVKEAEKLVEGKVFLTLGANFGLVGGKAQDLDAPAFIEDGRTFVPVRFLAEAFGAVADYEPKDAAVETVILTRDDMEIVIGIGDEFLTVTVDEEAEVLEFDGAARIVDGRTFLPFRAIAEAFDAEVDYGPKEGLVEWVSFE